MEKEEIVKCVDNSIIELIEVFCKTPYFFYTEHDIHCFLYQLIASRIKRNDKWHTIINTKKFPTLPIHREYPSKAIYIKDSPYTNEEYKKRSNTERGKRKHFDLVVFNDSYIDFSDFKNRNVSYNDPTTPFIAIQIGLDTDLKHLRGDWKSLNEPINCVDYKYLLHFDRKSHTKGYIDAIETEVNKYKDEIKNKAENDRIYYIDLLKVSKCKKKKTNIFTATNGKMQ